LVVLRKQEGWKSLTTEDRKQIKSCDVERGDEYGKEFEDGSYLDAKQYLDPN
jgi:hypothetical protein